MNNGEKGKRREKRPGDWCREEEKKEKDKNKRRKGKGREPYREKEEEIKGWT